jgi:hypothetical protein
MKRIVFSSTLRLSNVAVISSKKADALAVVFHLQGFGGNIYLLVQDRVWLHDHSLGAEHRLASAAAAPRELLSGTS